MDFETCKIIDISPVLSQSIAVYPGDQPFKRTVSIDFDPPNEFLLSSIQTTLHAGAHTDAPSHYKKGAASIDKVDLNKYLGPCQVIEVNVKNGERIYPKDLNGVSIQAKRVLFKTGSFPDPNKWRDDFNSLSPELVDHLAGKGVILIGIDTPSVDPATEKHLSSHQKIAEHQIAILEGILLNHVLPGYYTLIAMPLKIENGDSSLVRAVLLK